MPGSEGDRDPFEDLMDDEDALDLEDNDVEAALGVVKDDEGNVRSDTVVSGPEDLESGEGPEQVSFTINTGRFWDDGRPKQVHVTLSIPDNALDVAANYIALQTKSRAELVLWGHFVEGPEWLLEPERHGIYYGVGDQQFVARTKVERRGDSFERVLTEEYKEAFSEEEREEHEKKLLPKTLRKRLTEKIQLSAGVDGDFIQDRLAQMPPDTVRRAARLSMRSSKQQESNQSESESGTNETEQASTST